MSSSRRALSLLLAPALALPLAPPRFAPADARPVDAYGDRLPAGALARMGSVRLLHESDVVSVAFSPDGKTVASACAGNEGASIRVWDVATGRELHRSKRSRYWPRQVAFSPDGRVLAAVIGTDVYFWDSVSGQRVRQFIGHRDRVSCLAFSPDGNLLATAGLSHRGADWEQEVSLWDVAPRGEGNASVPLRGFGSNERAAGFIPAGTSPAARPAASLPNALSPSPRELRRLPGYRGGASTICFSVDGKRLLCCGDEILVWDPATGKLVLQDAPRGRSVALSPDGRTVAFEEGKNVRLWDLDADEPLRLLGVGTEYVRKVFSPDGRLLATGGGGHGWGPRRIRTGEDSPLRLWDVASGKEVRRFQGRAAQGAAPAAFSPDGKTLASVWGQEVRLWDVATGQESTPAGGRREEASCLALSADGKTLAFGGPDGTVRLWETRTGKERRCLEGHRGAVNAVAFSPDGRTVASGDDAGEIRLWDCATGKKRGWLEGPGGEVKSLRFSSDGHEVMATTWEGAAGVWEVGTGKLVRKHAGMRESYTTPALSPDGIILALPETEPSQALRGNGTGLVRLWSLRSGRELRTIRGRDEKYDGLVFSPDGLFLAAKGYELNHFQGWVYGAPVRVWEVMTGKEVLAIEPATSTPLAFSPDGRTLFSGGGDGRGELRECQAWDLATGRLLGRFPGHLGVVTALAVSPDGKLLATGSADGTALLWDAGQPPEARRLRPVIPAPARLDGPWADLAGPDAARAYQSLWALALAPERAVPFLRQRLHPAPRVEAEQVTRLIAALDSDRFAERRKATEELKKLGEMAEGALRKTLEGKPPLEVRRRVERLLERLDASAPSGDLLRKVRAVAALERIGTAEARKLLEELAGGAPEARLTREARAALRRLAAGPRAPGP